MSEFEKRLVIQLTKEQWEKLRKFAFDHQKSMNEIVREGIEIMIKKYEKKS